MEFAVPPPQIPTVPVVGGAPFPVRRIFCVGRNYAAHAREMGKDPDREPPFFFNKWAETIVIGGGEIAYPPVTENYHYEVELVVYIDKPVFRATAEEALACVSAYAVGLDMTRRDLQGEAKKLGRPWDVGKGFDHSAPIGPVRRAADCDIGPATRISLEVNGTMRQQSTIGKLIWSIPEIIEHLSSAWELAPGDLIFSGTPEGVAAVQAGDTLKAHVDGVGGLQVQIVAR
jgi:fumarylpyruvate hydrolase